MKRLLVNLKGHIDSSQAGSSTLQSKSKQDDLGFLELVPGIDPDIDIVAIHGLDGHRLKTWTADNNILWLRDLLPRELSNIRVMTYGYDADTRSRECVSTQTIYLHAESLLQDLSRIREGAPRRPIIFVAHSIGGIILKQAINICHVQPFDSKNSFRDILVSTHAVLFFGTPHSGTNGVELVRLMNRIMSVFLETNETVLKHLKTNSEELYNIQKTYISASGKINAIFFYEDYKTPISGGRKKLIVPHHSATVAGAATEVIHADHCQMVKFTGGNQENFQKVLSYMKRCRKDATERVAERWALEDSYRALARGDVPTSSSIVLPNPLPPVSRNFIERTEIHDQMSQILLTANGRRQQPRCILHGLGGSGKTQLAANWIREHANSFTRVIVVDGSSQGQLESDFERSIRTMGPEYGKATWKDAVAYMDGKERRWLLFIDSADSPDLDLDPYLPNSPHGVTIITTRNEECRGYAPDGAIQVGNLSEGEAVNLLHKVAKVTPASNDTSIEIIKELGMLALAITQAGVYILRTRRLDTYLETFRENRSRLMRETLGKGINYSSSTYAAFDMSFHQLPASSQEFMKICAFLHHSLIPAALFKQSARADFATYTVLKSCPPPESDKAIIQKLKHLLGETWNEVSHQNLVDFAAQASLISISTDKSEGVFYNIHPLIQTYIQDGLDKEESEHYMRMTEQLLLGAIRPLDGSNAWHRQLLSHINCVPTLMQLADISHALAFKEAYESLGNWDMCRVLLESALCQIQETHGQRNRDSMAVRGWLALAAHQCGIFDKAEQLEQEVLQLCLDILGKDHSDTIVAMINLANTLRARGRLEEAEKMKRKVLELRLKILGREHPHTIRAMSNLALTLHTRGQLDEAETMQREVLGLCLSNLERHDSDTIAAMNNLAVTLHNVGQLDEAETMQREVLELRLDILGQRHPGTIKAMSNLAITLHDKGLVEEAEIMEQEVLALRLDILGRRHPATLKAMKNFTVTLYEHGQLERAEQMGQEVLELYLDILGRSHPETITAMINLAIIVYDHGQIDRAEQMGREVLELSLHILGGRHPDTIRAMNHLTFILRKRGETEEAERIEKEIRASQPL